MTALAFALALTLGLAVGYAVGAWHMRRVYADLIQRLATNWGQAIREGRFGFGIVDGDDEGNHTGG